MAQSKKSKSAKRVSNVDRAYKEFNRSRPKDGRTFLFRVIAVFLAVLMVMGIVIYGIRSFGF